MYDRQELLAQIATLYYENNMTQSQIAKQLHLSRPTIAHMLKEARSSGIVSITINHPLSKLISSQEKITKYYNISSTHIVEKSASESITKRNLGQLCSKYIENRINDFNSIGIGWGSSLYEFVESASNVQTNNLTIIPLIGGVGMTNIKYHSNHLAFKLSEKYGADVSYFYAPAFAENKLLKEIFETSELYKQIYTEGLNVDIAIVGVGNPLNSSTYNQLNYFEFEEMRILKESDAIGDILGSFFNLEGQAISTSVTDRMLGIKISDLSRIKEKLILASGKEKYNAINVLLKHQLIDHLFIDQEIATLLIDSFEYKEF